VGVDELSAIPLRNHLVIFEWYPRSGGGAAML